jgi:uncharacterized protein YgiB involved in biofilm formation
MTDIIHPGRTMKRSRSARLLLMGVAPMALTACGEPPQEAMIYPDAAACISAGVQTREQCEGAQAAALAESERNAPRYRYREDCVADFGADQCRSTSGGFFMPFMSGFLIARALDGSSRLQPLYRPRSGEYATSGGYTVGRQPGRVIVDDAATKPQRAITQSRSGFGSRAAARGSWGG